MTNKPMLSVEREVIEKSLRDALTIRFDTDSHVTKLRALLDKPPAVRHNNVMPDWLKERFSEIEDDAMSLSGCAVFTQMRTKAQAYFEMTGGEISPVACVISFQDGVKEPEILSWNQLPAGEHRLYAEPPEPVAVLMPFAEKVIRKLQRFGECASDNQGADIGRHWFDLLTQLGLLNRVQRSPALWEMTQQGEDVLEVARLSGVKP